MSSLFSNGIDRRTFLKGSVATAAGLALGNPFFGGYANAGCITGLKPTTDH